MSEFERRVLDVVAQLQPGEVVCYSWVAAEAGRPGAARAVGRILYDLADDDTPWWRVVRADGTIVAPSGARQRRLLLDEGVRVVGGRVIEPPVRRR
ncbi:MAG TPA: MGMT family protein [Acidimicrobiales bacterium]